MIKATINNEKIIIPTYVEDIRDNSLNRISESMEDLFYKYIRIANKGTPEEEFATTLSMGYPNKVQDTANERTLRYIAENVLKDKSYTIERIESPDATEEERNILIRIY